MSNAIDVEKFLCQLADDDLIASELRKASVEHVNARLTAIQVVRKIAEQRQNMAGLIADALYEIEAVQGDGLGEEDLRATLEKVLCNFAEDSVYFADDHRADVAKIRSRLREVDEANQTFWAGMPAPRPGDLEPPEDDDVLSEIARLLSERAEAAEIDALERRLREVDGNA